jgi:hypothetical protein
MARLVTVTTQVLQGNGLPWVKAPFRFVLTGDTFNNVNHFPEKEFKFCTNDQGYLEAQLWDNSEGAIPTSWICTHPSQKLFEFVINAATPSTISLGALELLGIPQQNPNYNSILSEIIAQLERPKSADVPLSSAISGLGVSVQSALVALSNKKLAQLPDVSVNTATDTGFLFYNQTLQNFTVEPISGGGNW